LRLTSFADGRRQPGNGACSAQDTDFADTRHAQPVNRERIVTARENAALAINYKV
jgi:hypothetical protein